MGVQSFEIDHTKLKAGLYLNKVQSLGHGTSLVTVDMRLFGHDDMNFSKSRASFLEDDDFSEVASVFHTLEHEFANYFRSEESGFADDVVYVGPGGCQTMFYFVFLSGSGHHPWEDSDGHLSQAGVAVLFTAFYSVLESMKSRDYISGATEEQCGNFVLHNRQLAIRVLEDWLDRMRLKPCFSYN